MLQDDSDNGGALWNDVFLWWRLSMSGEAEMSPGRIPVTTASPIVPLRTQRFTTALFHWTLRGSNKVRQGASSVGMGTRACAGGRYAVGVATFYGRSGHLWWP